MAKRKLDEHTSHEDDGEILAIAKSFNSGPEYMVLKPFVRAGTSTEGYTADSQASEVYQPPKKLQWTQGFSDVPPVPEELSSSPPLPTARSSAGPREIDSVVAEIRQRQSLVQQRKHLRSVLTSARTPESERKRARLDLEAIESISNLSEADDTTNLYIGNLAPTVTEATLQGAFGRYGTISSVKIMYPRTPQEQLRGRLCGFVSYLKRAEAQQAKDTLDGAIIEGMPMRIGWGKAVPKASHIDAPTAPARSRPTGFSTFDDRRTQGHLQSSPSEILPTAASSYDVDTIHVAMPVPRFRRVQIDLIAKYVAEHGASFEATLQKLKGSDPSYKFLTDFDDPEYQYFRWRVIVESHGESTRHWRSMPFEIFENGRLWVPPPLTQAETSPAILALWPDTQVVDAAGIPTGLVGAGRQPLCVGDAEDLKWKLQTLNRSRSSIKNAMLFCMSKADSSIAISRVLLDTVQSADVHVESKIAHLYLLSDVLHNTFSLRHAAWSYRLTLERQLPDTFKHLNEYSKRLSPVVAQLFAARVVAVLSAWHSWAVYSVDFLEGLEANYFADDSHLQQLLDLAEPVTPQPSFKGCDGAPLSREWMTRDLQQVPVWMRRDLMGWLKVRDDLGALEKICHQLGVSISDNPQGDPDVLIKRLIIRATYVRHKQELNRKNAVLETGFPHKAVRPAEMAMSNGGAQHAGAEEKAKEAAIPSRAPPNRSTNTKCSGLEIVSSVAKPSSALLTNDTISISDLLNAAKPKEVPLTVEPTVAARSCPSAPDDDDDMFGENVPVAKSELTEADIRRKGRLKQIEGQVHEYGRQLRAKGVSESEVLIRCDDKRLQLVEKVKDDLLDGR